MMVERQLGSSRKPNARLAPRRPATHPHIGNAYGFFNSEYGFVGPLATPCKQSLGDLLIANSLSRGDRRRLAVRFLCSSRAVLPETLNRVESLVSHRKHTVGCASTRDTRYQRFASFSQPRVVLLHLTFTNYRFGRRTGIPARVLPAMPGRHSPVTTHCL
jgi:hypothetical protein